MKHLLLTHFRVHMDSEEGHAATAKVLADHFKGPSAIVEDLDTFDV